MSSSRDAQARKTKDVENPILSAVQAREAVIYESSPHNLHKSKPVLEDKRGSGGREERKRKRTSQFNPFHWQCFRAGAAGAGPLVTSLRSWKEDECWRNKKCIDLPL